ncbi:MAG: ATP-binding protein [Acidobacteria bacterium]|nr:ATP-binding protein [Acidobacteriota bacterium]
MSPPYETLVSPHPLEGGADGAPLWHAVCAAEIPALPVRAPSPGAPSPEAENRFAWRFFIAGLHGLAAGSEGVFPAYALQTVVRPRSNYGVKARFYFVVRAAAAAREVAAREAGRLLSEALKIFPSGDARGRSPRPRPLTRESIHEILFLDAGLELAAVRKHVEEEPGNAAGDAAYEIPHLFFPDAERSPWPYLLSAAEHLDEPLALRVELAPVTLRQYETDYLVTLQHYFAAVARDGEGAAGLLDQRATYEQFRRHGSSDAWAQKWVEQLSHLRALDAARLTPQEIQFARRAREVAEHLSREQAQLFDFGLTLAAAGGHVPTALTSNLVAALVSGRAGRPDYGWQNPAVFRPTAEAAASAAESFRWLCTAPAGRRTRLYDFVTGEEAVGLFHLPVLPFALPSVSAASTPFSITDELLTSCEGADESERVTLGFLYHSGVCFDPPTVGAGRALPFSIAKEDVTKPMICSGSPGAGKTNFLFGFLIACWKLGIPFCVLDPTNAQEYRYLLADESLCDALVVYTAGDNLSLPFRFNPFAVPPSGPGGSITVRAHITRVLAAFKAASEFWDPLTAIFQDALLRVYEDGGWEMDDTHETGVARGLSFPTFAAFAEAMRAELEQSVIPDYGEGTEAAGVILGATKARVGNILRHLGHVLNVDDDGKEFFQNLLRTPCVIELGALGSEDAISLVMSFLTAQIVGHTEYAYRAANGRPRPHVLSLEEAHVMLSDESSARAQGPHQGNARGKAAGDLARLFAEFRKFGCGLVLLDQRVASLVGGPRDNAYFNLFFRTADAASFDHLARVTNLDAQQLVYARARLDRGQAIVLDRYSGSPALIRALNVIDGLRDKQPAFGEFVSTVAANAARAGLRTPEPLPRAGAPTRRYAPNVFQPRRLRATPQVQEVR